MKETLEFIVNPFFLSAGTIITVGVIYETIKYLKKDQNSKEINKDHMDNFRETYRNYTKKD